MGRPRTVTIEYHRPPDRRELFRQRLLAEGPDALVTFLPSTPMRRPATVDGRPILEDGSPVVWFTFPGAWHDIGRFHLRDGSFTGYYANVLTPVEIEGDAWRTTDLFLDLFVPAWDAPARVLDEDELAEAERRGWLDATTVARAREEAARLLRRARAGSWPPDVVRAWTLERAQRSG